MKPNNFSDGFMLLVLIRGKQPEPDQQVANIVTELRWELQNYTHEVKDARYWAQRGAESASKADSAARNAEIAWADIQRSRGEKV